MTSVPKKVKRIGPAERTMIPVAPGLAGAASAALTGGMSLPLFVGGTALGRFAGMGADALRRRYGSPRGRDTQTRAEHTATRAHTPVTLADGLEALVSARRSSRRPARRD